MAREGIDAARVHFVGNTMIDTLERLLPRARGGEARERLRLTARAYGLVTLHRPSNVDDVGRLEALLGALRGICAHVPLAWPVHPRTRARLGELHEAGGEQAGGAAAAGPPAPRLLLTEPLGYLDFLQLMDGARLVLAGSDGIQGQTSCSARPASLCVPPCRRPARGERKPTDACVASRAALRC